MISAWDCFRRATLELVRSSPIKKRLVSAYSLHLAGLPPEHVPDEVRGSYCQVTRALSEVKPLRGENAVAASVRKMSNQEADDCATLIVEIFGMISRRQIDSSRIGNVLQLPSLELNADYEIPTDFQMPALARS